MGDFLRFDIFIAKDVLLFFYYIGALFLPVLIFFVYRKFFVMLPGWSQRNRFWAIIAIIIFFIIAEMMWRVMFEVMIGYFDIHDYLHEIMRH